MNWRDMPEMDEAADQIQGPATGLRQAGNGLLLVDLYELSMLEAFWANSMAGTAVFEFFVRKLPSSRGFLVAAGLEQLLDFLSGLRFSDVELAYLRESGHFGVRFVDSLAELRFTGDVDAMAEGTPFFADEPIVRVVAPLPQAQLIESRLINLLHFQTVIASKAARLVLAAPGIPLIDFGLRRAHGAEAGLLATRASYLAGFAGTATLLAEPTFGIPVFGTMAHSFIQAHDDESTAFERFARVRPDRLTLLIDTFNTEIAAQKVVQLAPRLQAAGIAIAAVRLDSGDLVEHARKVRRILDEGNLSSVSILASGGIDEDQLQRFIREKAPIDSCGIGTSLTTAPDAPSLDCAYKLQEYAGRPRLKRSEGKATWPGRKQIFRRYDADGIMIGDTVALESDRVPGEPLLQPVMRSGRRLSGPSSLVETRSYAAASVKRLPADLRRLESAAYPVEIDPRLKKLAASL
ncbi:nicotinate phosphoribosyltransferase [Dongia sedimenti]|uniref:Nicotinate phosphoribosyltransferase n=1 Tax=Dongia sedimenti TaxID=3064282 RepID=A0ABU0YTF6_9PROT|nr:nicotinate phosphoribosyltransferase [Rhodospirillaceae bacterium R-7]